VEEASQPSQRSNRNGAFLYIMGCCWLLKVMEDDRRPIFQAASYTSQAADWIRRQAEPEVEPETDKQKSEREPDDAITY
jgi:antirestriction protein ArdC